MRDRFRLQSCPWIRDTQLREDARRYRSNVAGMMAALRMAALNPLRLAGFGTIPAGLQAVMMYDIMAMLVMARRQPESSTA